MLLTKVLLMNIGRDPIRNSWRHLRKTFWFSWDIHRFYSTTSTVRFGSFKFRWAIASSFFTHLRKTWTASVDKILIFQGAMQFVSNRFYSFVVNANSPHKFWSIACSNRLHELGSIGQNGMPSITFYIVHVSHTRRGCHFHHILIFKSPHSLFGVASLQLP